MITKRENKHHRVKGLVRKLTRWSKHLQKKNMVMHRVDNPTQYFYVPKNLKFTFSKKHLQKNKCKHLDTSKGETIEALIIP